MKYSSSVLTAATLFTTTLAAVVPSEPWATLTPSAKAPKGAKTDYTATFGVAVVPITGTTTSGGSVSTETGAPTAGVAKRDVISQIGDGQIQASTGTPSTTSAAPKSTAQAISQIGDGQIQATTNTESSKPKSTAQAISQIGDGQIQATTNTESSKPKSTAQAISQIGDGQIQATTNTEAPKSTAQAISQIGDGQIQATTNTEASKSSATAVSQITDGQIQATGASNSTASATESANKASGSADSKSSSDDNVKAQSCKADGSLALELKGGVLTDSAGRLGSIVANRQFQFDGPPPQAGAIYAGGWSITEEGVLALGDSDKFYQCLSGNFYNLYDQSVADQCHEIKLEVIELVDC
ncbi:hypothetical protein BN7_515 [Wickerhamomyces ciferrii]|uniref:Cell wall mannoprotein PIR1-like C-terminal domain-containing protein n=1 Tax=Wickerhamomyces ciferrii (strain ATCC 14091 / BCRC 22168 / CBS 111 / JCM 3599 / NBRC 0793 / NRRL Y-1031 F-60-10) TaxID=1206466 RepID=K0KIJ3_WICCF|nr:uncharacterized protein BN7_515 [Wickerhamomyces ciferrii]CCH40978.1 hypothetical protein BN7_515 [Wickerhamomyces ciferrii]